VSCNYFFAQLGYQLGLSRLNEYAAGLGLGQATGIELGERLGSLPESQQGEDLAPWAGFGQANMAFTPLQLANYTAALVRGGVRYNAHLLESVTSYDGSETIYTSQTETLSTVEMSEATLAAVKKGMGDLATTGTVGAAFANCVVSAGAKTGSAQTGETLANGVFICFAPFDEPEVAVAIVIEQAGAGAALANAAVEILNAYFSPDDVGAAYIAEGELLP
jgi:penicillin-binding protein 2